MNFLAPAALGLLALLPVIVAMYLLKLRRPEREVPSVYLWRRMVRDVEANAPWQRLRRNLLLILQLLFLLALILALARPFTWAAGAGGQAAILILDTSASMGATDVEPTRLEAAKAQASRIIADLPDETRVTVISAGSQAQVLLASSQDRRQALLAVENVRLENGSSDLTVALELASAVAARQPDTEIIVLSDGGAVLPERLALKGRLRYLPIGIHAENQAISILNLEDGAGGGGPVAFAQISNYGDSPARRRLSLFAGGDLFNVYDLEIPAGGQRAVLAEDMPPDTGWVEGRLEPISEDETDYLPTDDRALAVRSSREPISVTLVTEGNLFLQTALELLPALDLTVVAPEDFTPETPEGREAATRLTIFDGFVPTAPLTPTQETVTAPLLPPGNLLYVAPIRSTEFFSVTGTIENPIPRPVTGEDPLLKYVSLADVSVLDAARIPLPLWARPVIAGDVSGGDTGSESRDPASSPLLFAGETGGRRVAVLAFDLRRSDLPLQMAFPVLWANLIGWLAPGSAGGAPAQVAPGEGLVLSLPPGIEQVQLTRPDGSQAEISVESGQAVIADTHQLGIYTLRWGEAEEARFAVNLFSPQESRILPSDELPGVGAGSTGEAAAEGAARREWWRPIALLALLVLTVEWMVYQRAGLARLRDDLLKLARRGGQSPSGVKIR